MPVTSATGLPYRIVPDELKTEADEHRARIRALKELTASPLGAPLGNDAGLPREEGATSPLLGEPAGALLHGLRARVEIVVEFWSATQIAFERVEERGEGAEERLGSRRSIGHGRSRGSASRRIWAMVDIDFRIFPPWRIDAHIF